jgi:2-polyprenyl-6-methoxyphenol hydroxylase-like FAD-dependent oxidoreductase
LSDIQGTTADVIIIGAGLAGASAAAVLERQGVRVTLVDQRKTCPDCFKAEKIESDQADALRRLGLFDVLAPHATRIHEVRSVWNGRFVGARKLEQYGVNYGDLVNAVRQSIPSTAPFRQARVESILTSPDVQQVTLDSGEVLTSRLIVFACGTVNALASQLSLHREMVAKDFSMAFGFTVARRDGRPFAFDALTYYPSGSSTRVAYLTLFPIGNAMRANLFVFRSINDEWVRTFLRDPHAQLDSSLPKLTAVIGDYEIVSKVETGRIDLYRVQNHRQAGLVLIGDASQSVCPTTGTGLSKVFTDVEVLCHDCVPTWLSTPGMDQEKISQFYDHPRKQAVDARSLDSALYNHHSSTSSSIRSKIRVVRDYWTLRYRNSRSTLG